MDAVRTMLIICYLLVVVLSYFTLSLFFYLYGAGKQKFVAKVGEEKTLVMKDMFKSALFMNIAGILAIVFLQNIPRIKAGLYQHPLLFLFFVLEVLSLIFVGVSIIFGFRYTFADYKLKKKLVSKTP